MASGLLKQTPMTRTPLLASTRDLIRWQLTLVVAIALAGCAAPNDRPSGRVTTSAVEGFLTCTSTDSHGTECCNISCPADSYEYAECGEPDECGSDPDSHCECGGRIEEDDGGDGFLSCSSVDESGTECCNISCPAEHYEYAQCGQPKQCGSDPDSHCECGGRRDSEYGY